MPQIDVFVINLERSKERRAQMENQLGYLGLAYRFIEAVDGDKLSEEEVRDTQARASDLSRRFPDRAPISRGEIGCALSHLKTYEKVVNDNLDYACIMEDDLCIDHPQDLVYIMERKNLLALRRKQAFDFIYLNLYFKPNSDWRRLIPHIDSVDLYARWWKTKVKTGLYLCKPCDGPLWGTRAYIINRKACEILLEEGHPVKTLADVLTSRAELFGVRQYFLSPFPISHDKKLNSTIDPDNLVRQGRTTKPSYSTTKNARSIIKIARATITLFLRKLGIITLKTRMKRFYRY